MTEERWKECTNHHHGCACREHEWEERVATLKAELELVKSNYEYLKGDWNKTCELAKEHCPCPLGTSHITDGIPRLAERARRLEAEVERLQARLTVTAQILVAEVGADRPLNADDVAMRAVVRIRELVGEVERLKGETYCAYCGKRFPLENTDSTDFIGEHIACCQKHPMVAAQAELNFLKEEVARLTEKADEKEDNLLSARSVITAVRAELLASQVPLGPNSKAKALKVHIRDAIMLMKGQP